MGKRTALLYVDSNHERRAFLSYYAGILAVAATVLMVGCTSTIRTTDPPRTATEQFLLSQAATRAVAQLSFDALRGRKVYVDSSHFAAPESSFVVGELRSQLLLNGVQLMRSLDDAQIALEVHSAGVGIDRSDFLMGIPSLLISAGQNDTTGARTPFATPELAIIKNINQAGIASVAFVAYWIDTGEIVATSGPYIGRTLRDDWWIIGFGPRTIGNIAPIEAATDTASGNDQKAADDDGGQDVAEEVTDDAPREME